MKMLVNLNHCQAGEHSDLGLEIKKSNYPELIQHAIALIQKNYAQLYGVEEVAEELSVSKCHLVRLFSKSVGISPGRYLTAVRITVSKRYLSGKDYPVEVVATLSGFSGANYFCKVFKSKTGQSPLEYRRTCCSTRSYTEMTEMEKRLYL